MNRHPDIRQRTALSAKSLRWRRVEFLRPFPGSMGSAPLEAIVSSFFEQISTGVARSHDVGKILVFH
jgi:hypothetical protein